MAIPPWSIWPPISPSSSSSAGILSVDSPKWVDPINGSDSAAGTEAAPWATIAKFNAFVTTYVEINAIVTCNIVVSDLESLPTADFPQFTCPPLGVNGKIVYRSDGVLNQGDPFTVDVGSTGTLIQSLDYPAGDWAGYQLVALTGDLTGTRALINENTPVIVNPDPDPPTPATIEPANQLLAPPAEGDTWQIYRPAATVNFPNDDDLGTTVYGGNGSGMPSGSFGNNQAGIYFVNLRMRGKPNFSNTQIWCY